MTVIRHNSISGIVSITAATGSNLAFYDSTGSTLSLDTGDINAGVITATTANFTNATISGDLTVNGTTTTLDTTVTEVDRLEVGANNSTVGVAITQSGSGDILRLYDGATQVVTVKDGGNFGIGTDNPRTKLEIAGNTYNSGGYSDGQVQIVGNNPIAFVSQSNLNPAVNRWGFQIRAAGGDGKFSIYDFANSRHSLLIDSSGNVGIGTDNTNNKLHVWDGSLTLESTSASGNAWTYYKNADRTWLVGIRGSSGDALSFYDLTSGTDTERMRIDSGGLVGINQTNPQRHLHVKSGANSNDGAFRIESATSNIMDMGTDVTGHFLNCVNADPFRIKFAGSEKFRFLSGGGITFNGDTASTNALDDYEEGTATISATPSSGTISVTSQRVRYTKIGRLVTLTGFFQTSQSSASGNVTFGGLPVNTANTTGGGAGGTCQVWKYNGGNPTEIYPCNIHVVQNSTTFEMYFKNSSGNAEQIEAADMNGTSNIGQVYSFHLSYTTS